MVTKQQLKDMFFTTMPDRDFENLITDEEVVKDVMVINVSYLGRMSEKTMEMKENA